MRKSIVMALKSGSAPIVLGVAMLASPAFAAPAANAAAASDADNVIVVVGSSIKQSIDKSTLPVTVVSSKDIAKTGVTSATDLIQNLPAMQGFVPASSSVNGGGGGVTTAAIHALPSKYTLTLVDGLRMAPMGLGAVQGGGYGVNIESIPLDAVESVEVLRDGAGALYGADAVAGVVNFRLKKDYTEGNIYMTGDATQHGGGNSWSAGISKGFGKLAEDGYNIFFSYSHDQQNPLAASQRDFSKNGGYFPFSVGGSNYIFFSPSSNTEPANITVAGKTFNPYYQANGNCGTPNAFPLTTSSGLNCRFNYAATVQDVPSSKRDSGMLKATSKAGDDGEIWVSAVVSKYDMTAQYAPSAQPMGLNATTRFPSLWNAYVAPFLAANGLTATTATLNYRSVSAGGRTDDYGSLTANIAMGYDGKIAGFDVHASLSKSHVHATDKAAGGYTDFNALSAAVASGAYNPVMGTGASVLSSSVLGSTFSTTESDVMEAKFNVQHKLLTLPGGDAIAVFGGEYDRTSYGTAYSPLILSQSGFSTQPASADYPVGGNYGQVPFGARRNNWGLFTEMKFPVVTGLEINAQGRYDNYSKVHSSYVFATAADPVTGLQDQLPAADLGNTFHAFTGKLSFRYAPDPMIAIRGAVGTGFRAPALSDIAGAVTFAGSTSGTYACPFPGSVGCLPGSAQYDLLAGANGNSGSAGLKPEKSVNWGLGFSFTPASHLYFNVDYWNVKINQAIQSAGVSEESAYTNPSQYAGLFVNPYMDPAGFQTIALMQVPYNAGGAKYSGIDWDFGYATRTSFGKFSANWMGTWTLTQGVDPGDGTGYQSDLGKYGLYDQQVVFRVVSSLVLSLETGKFTNTLSGHFKSGYTDEPYTAGQGVVFTSVNGQKGVASDLGTNGVPGNKVPAIATFDWQSVYQFSDMLKMTVGIKNLLDQSPPLSLQTGGGGNQVGYDGRYYDPLGRNFYARVNIKF